MNLPKQAQPVARVHSIGAFAAEGIGPSDSIACTLCKTACDALPGFAKQLCLLACSNTVCN